MHQRGGHVARRFRHGDAALGEDLFLRLGGIFLPTDNGSGVPHAAAGRRGGSGDEAGDRLLAILLRPARGLHLRRAADLANHDDRFGLGVVVEHFEHIEVGGAVDRVAADADAGALAVAHLGELKNRLIGERAGAGNNTDVATLVDVAGRYADAATAVAFLAASGGHEAGAVRADQARPRVFQRVLHSHHVHDRDALGDADDQLHTGVHRLKDRIGRERRRDENRGGCGSRFTHRLANGVENGNHIREFLSAFAGGHAGHEFRPVIKRELCVACAEGAGDALHEDFGVFVNEDGHGFVLGSM